MDSQYPNEAKLHFLDYWRVVRVRLGLVILAFVLVLITTAVVTLTTPKQYQSFATIEIEPDMTPVRIFENEPAASSLNDAKFSQTQFQIITRKGVLYPVIDQLDLTHRWGTANAPISKDGAYGRLMGMLSLQEVRNTNLIQINVLSADPQEAALVANTVAQVYMDQRVAEQHSIQSKSLDQLRDEVHEKEVAVAKAFDEASRLRTQTGINDPNPDSLDSSARIEDTSVNSNQEKVNEMRSQVAALRSRVGQLEQVKTDDLMRAAGMLNLNDPVVTQKLPVYQSLLSDRARMLSSGLGRNHPDVKAVQAQVDTLEQQLKQQIESLRKGLATQLAIAEDSLKAMQTNLSTSQSAQQEMKTASARYLDAKYRYIQERKLLEAAKTRLSSQTMELAMPQRPAYFRDRAEPARFPSRPRVFMNLAVGAGAGLLLGIGLAFLLEYLDTSVKTMEDVETAFGSTVLAVVPKNIKVLKEALEDTPDAEAYRILKTNVDIARKKVNASVLSLVSGGPGEGKSTTVCNLAQTYAWNGQNVLVIDGDLRRPAQHRLFGLDNRVGLGNYLKGKVDFERAVQATNHPSLHVLTSGNASTEAVGLLSSQSMHSLLEMVRERYDVVLIDCPPILGVSDASIISTLVDASIVVVQHRRFPRSMLMRVKKVLDGFEANLLGVVLNNVDVRHDQNSQYYTSYTHYYTKADKRLKAERKDAARAGAGKSAAVEAVEDDY
ncbi:MAG TPA: polysaccharide biosynthesis tyrosine autokinase [Chthoniobacterales bacterium]